MTSCRSVVVAALALSLAAGALSLGTSRASAAVELVPHRAVYALKLGASRQTGVFVGARGGLTLTVEKTCDGWVTSQDMAMQLETAQGTEVRQAIRYSGWESMDGKNYRFVARSQTGQENRRDSAGSARLESERAAGQAEFKKPEAKTVVLPPGTMFPVTHAIWLIERALAGVHTAPGIVFDGTDGTGPQQVSVFIGKRQEPSEHGKATLGPLTEQAGWTMRLAFYPAEGRDASPEYEMEVLQLVNGVAPRMLVDYREFSIQFEIREIEAVPEPKCQ